VKRLDLKKTLKPYFQPRANRVELVDVPEFSYLMLDGRVEPGVSVGESPAFQEAFQAIYGVAFTLKFMSKLGPGTRSIQSAPEGCGGPKTAASLASPWAWTLMMIVPDHVTATMFRDAVERVGEKRPNPSLARLRLEPFREGLAVQALHVGPYADEQRTMDRMAAFAESQGYRFRGKHHEIYLGDPAAQAAAHGGTGWSGSRRPDAGATSSLRLPPTRRGAPGRPRPCHRPAWCPRTPAARPR
jgi:hypothetical protein